MITTPVQAVASATSYEHFTWFNAVPGYNELNADLASRMGNSIWQGVPVESVTQVFLALLMAVITVTLTYIAGKRLRDPKRAIVPETTLTPRNFFEIVLDGVMGLAEDGVGEKYAKQILPLVGTVTLYVFFSNILGLLPGFAPPTDNLNATVAPALVVFFATHYFGIKEHGVINYGKHFLGPVPAIAPLYLVIEIIGHLARVLSLSFRLMGNMIGDHKVLAAFLALTAVSYIFPVPMWFLGLIVCTVQTLVFALLTVVYIQLATAHEDH